MDQYNENGDLSRFKKFFKYGVIGMVAVVVVLIILSFVLASLNSARNSGLSTMDYYGYSKNSPGNSGRADYAETEMAEMDIAMRSLSYPPYYNQYVPGLEQYETTDYQVNATTKDFDEACALLPAMKAESDIHFKQLSESLNRCHATFFTSESTAASVRERLAAVPDVVITRSTESVTREREVLQSQSDILREQLETVEETLAEANVQYDDITKLARSSGDAAALTEAIRDKLEIIESLTQRRIALTNQLRQHNQQAAELNERIDMVMFSVTLLRANPVNPGEFSRKWQRAWEELTDQFHQTLINFSAYFGIFLLWLIQLAVYGLVLVVLARGFWKIVRMIWNYQRKDHTNTDGQ